MQPTTSPASPPDGRAWEGRRERRGGGTPSLLDPIYIGRAVWNAKVLLAGTTIFGVLVAVLVAMTTPKLYLATAQILMDPRDLKVVANEVTPNGLPSEAALALVESQTSVILSGNILSRVVAKAGLKDDAEFNGSRRSGLLSLLPASVSGTFGDGKARPGDGENRTIERLRRAMSVGREAKSFVINLSVGSSDPDKSAKLANVTAEIFIDEQGRVQSDTARRATAALTSRLSELRRSVVETENNVEAYKSRNALIGVGGKLVDDEYITRINDQLAKARGDITALRVKAASMRTASVEDVVRGALPEEQASQGLARLRQSYSDLAQQNAALATKLGPRHPQRIASEGALASTRQAIASELSRIVAAAQTELARATETERDLTSQIDELKTRQVAVSSSFVKLRELEREVDASRAVYEAFLQRARETSEQENLNTANVRVISGATPPLQASGMSGKAIVAAGGIAGFFAGIALAASAAVLRRFGAYLAGDRRRGAPGRPSEPADASEGERRRPSETPPGEVPTAGGDLRASPSRAAYAGSGERHPEAVAPSGVGRYEPSAAAATEHVAEASGAIDAGAERRRALRDRVRALSAGRPGPDAAPGEGAALTDPDVALLRNEIETVKSAIADMRRRRTGLVP